MGLRKLSPLGKLSGRHAFVTKLQDLGFDEVTEDDMKELFSKFKVLADKKHEITDADIRALVAGTTVENPEGFQFDNLVISSNDDGTQTVTISLKMKVTKLSKQLPMVVGQ